MTKTTWVLDPTHSEIQFKAKHLMITNVTGSFNSLNATVETGSEDFTDAKIFFSAKTDSINTANEQRDAHLKSAEFFDAEKFPEITFTSSSLQKQSGDTYLLHGDLSIKGVTKPITLNAEYGGTQKDPWGNMKSGFSVNGKFKRSDWGLSWNAALETGGVLVSEEIKIQAEVQFVKQA